MTTDAAHKRKLGVIVLVLLGAVLRLWNFWQPAPWLDEYGTWWVAAGSWKEVFSRSFAVSGMAPFFHLFVKLSFSIFGSTVFALRFPSVVIGIGIVAFTYPLGLRLFRNKRAAFYSVLASAINQPLIWYSQESRPYALGILCAMVSCWFYLGLLDQEKAVRRGGYIAATAAAYYAHYLFAVIVLVHWAHLLLLRKTGSRQLRDWAATYGIILLLCLAGAPHVHKLVSLRHVLTFLPQQGFSAVLGVGRQLLAVQVVGPVIILAMLLRLLSKRKEAGFYRGWSFLVLWFIVPLIAIGCIPPLFGVSLLADTHTVHAIRYVIVSLPSVVFLIGAILSSVGGNDWRHRAPVYLFVVLQATLYLSPSYAHTGTFGTWPQEGYVSAAAVLAQQVQATDVILFSSGYAEADALTASNSPEPRMIDYLCWPIVAHSPAIQKKIMLIPTRINSATQAYLDSVIERVQVFKRVWVVGKHGSALRYTIDQIANKGGRPASWEATYGMVQAARFDLDSSE